MPQVTADLTDEQYQALLDIASKRGVDANTALQQAISTEKLIADNVNPSDDLLIKRSDNQVTKINFA